MATLKKKNYMELQMEELKKATLEGKSDDTPTVKKSARATQKDLDIAKLYEDAAEYEEDLEGFEAELEVINSTELKNIPSVLTQKIPNEERDYPEEFKAILVANWTHFVETEKTHPKEQLELIQNTQYCDIFEKFNSIQPEYEGSFEEDVKSILTKRWEMLIAIKKEHIKQEHDDIKIAGLKPKWVKRVYDKVQALK